MLPSPQGDGEGRCERSHLLNGSLSETLLNPARSHHLVPLSDWNDGQPWIIV